LSLHGEILKNKDEVRKLFEVPEILELMAIIAAGYPEERKRTSTRQPLPRISWLNKHGNKLDLETD